MLQDDKWTPLEAGRRRGQTLLGRLKDELLLSMIDFGTAVDMKSSREVSLAAAVRGMPSRCYRSSTAPALLKLRPGFTVPVIGIAGTGKVQ